MRDKAVHAVAALPAPARANVRTQFYFVFGDYEFNVYGEDVDTALAAHYRQSASDSAGSLPQVSAIATLAPYAAIRWYA